MCSADPPCTATCSPIYYYGTSVTLTATPSADSPLSTFTGWSNGCTGTGTCTLSMTQARSVTATFTKVVYALSLTKTSLGGGRGTITAASVGGTNTCDTGCSTQSWIYDPNTVVTLTATPDASNQSVFTGWGSGACSGVVGDCTVTMNAAKSVSATFEAPQVLTVLVTGRGTGGVSGGGISCPGTCSVTLKYGTSVRLVAEWPAGSTFAGWSSGSCGLSSVCDVTMSSPVDLIATFNPPSAVVSFSKVAANGDRKSTRLNSSH